MNNFVTKTISSAPQVLSQHDSAVDMKIVFSGILNETSPVSSSWSTGFVSYVYQQYYWPIKPIIADDSTAGGGGGRRSSGGGLGWGEARLLLLQLFKPLKPFW